MTLCLLGSVEKKGEQEVMETTKMDLKWIIQKVELTLLKLFYDVIIFKTICVVMNLFSCSCEPGGVLELFFDGVSGPKSGTPTHIKGFFSLKNGWFYGFFEIFRKSGPISKGFSTSKMADFTIFLQFLWNRTLF